MNSHSPRAPRSLLVVIDSLAGGGAERVMTTLTREWVANGDRVQVALLSPEVPARYALDPAIPVHRLDSGGRFGWISLAVRTLRRTRALRKIIRETRPDIVIGFMPRANSLCILAGAGAKLVASERAMPELSPPATRLAMRLLYSRCRMLVCVSERVSRTFAWLPGERRRVIRNPVERSPAVKAEGLPPRPFVLAAGRLSREKRFDILIKAFEEARALDGLDLLIFGEGPERHRLEALVREGTSAARIHLLGWTDNLAGFISACAFFVLSSESEGLPNALIEAMASGKAVVATACAGAMEIVDPEVDGLLVPVNDVPALAAAMERVWKDTALRARLERAGALGAQRYGLAGVLDEWERVFREMEAR